MYTINNITINVNLSNVIGYPYRTGRLVGQFLDIDTYELDEYDREEVFELREALANAANMRDDNHICYQIVGGPAIMFHDCHISIGMSVKNW